MKKLSFSLHLIVYLLVLFILPNCSKYEQKKLGLPKIRIERQRDVAVSKKGGVLVARKTLSEKECRQMFNKRRIRVRGYEAIQLYIKNKSNNTYILDPSLITLPLEPVTNVARKLHRNVGGKTTKYWLLTGFGGVIEAFASTQANKNIDDDLTEKAIDDDSLIKIKPHRVINRVIFVAKENYSPIFNLTLIEEQSKKELKFYL